MNICFLTGAYPPIRCGVGDQVKVLAQGLSAADDTVAVLTSDRVPWLVEKNFGVYPVMPTWQLGMLPKLIKALRKISPHIVHLHYPSHGFERGMAPNLVFPWLRYFQPACKRVVTLHEYATYTQLGRWRLWPVIQFAHRIICTNQHDQEQVLADYPGCADRMQVIPLGSNVGSAEGYARIRLKKYKLPDKKKNWLLHFGTVMPNKGWEVLVPALERLVREGMDVGLIAIGDLQPDTYAYHQQVQNLIRQAGLVQHIHFTGYLPEEEIAAAFAALPVVVLPFTDGIRLNRSSLIAALAYERAIVSIDPLYQVEQLKHGQQFWGVIPHDAPALAEGIKQVCQDPALIRKLQAGAKQAAEYFSWTRIFKLYRGLYLHVAGK